MGNLSEYAEHLKRFHPFAYDMPMAYLEEVEINFFFAMTTKLLSR